jgi:eukaryotic-like serine/threonine-protein kinase
MGVKKGSEKRDASKSIDPDALAQTIAPPPGALGVPGIPLDRTQSSDALEQTGAGAVAALVMTQSDAGFEETALGGGALALTQDSHAVLGSATPRIRPALNSDGLSRINELAVGSMFAGYKVLERIGEGGMGVVYAAYDQTLDRKIALKLLRSNAEDETERAAATAKVMREAQAMAKLSHPNAVTVFQVGIQGSAVFIAMDFVDGMTLTAWLKKEPRPWRDIVKVLVQAGRGLEAAHRAELVHRDFKPDNVLIGHNGDVRVTDFGLARQLGSMPVIQLNPTDAPIQLSTMTMTGQIVGTPMYMAPEQHRAEPVDGRADQFSFCVTLYEALFNQRPFVGTTYSELAVNVATGQIRPLPATPSVPRYVRNALLRGLRTEPNERYPSMTALLAELDRGPTSRRNVALAGLGVVGIGVGIALSLLSRQNHVAPCADSEARMASIWNNDKRDAIAKSFAATQLPYAEATRTSVLSTVDSRAGDWIKMHHDTCEATRVRGEQSEALLDRRMQCLNHKRAELAAFVDLLAAGGKDIVQNAVVSARQLHSLDACADTDALMSGVEIPRDPAVRAELEQLERELTRGRLMLKTSRFDDGLKIARDVADRARRVHYGPAEAEALLLEGLIEAERGNAKIAEDKVTQAVERADVSRADLIKATALVDLVYIVGYTAREVPKAEMLVNIARSTIERLGNQPELEAKLVNNTGAFLFTVGRYAEAITDHKRALEILHKKFGEDNPDVAAALNMLAVSELRMGQEKEAREHHQRAFDILTRVMGAEHPDTAQALNNLGNDLATTGDYAGAEQSYRKALDLLTRAYGPKHAEVAIAQSNLGALALAQGDHAHALVEFQKALDIEREVLGPNHPNTAETLASLGQAYLGSKDYARAVEVLTEALKIYHAQPNMAKEGQLAKFTIAQALWQTGDRSRALTLANEAKTALVAEGASTQDTVDDITDWLSGK